MKQQPIEVSIISGFLGAGKTTLLNHMLASLPDKRIFVIENEFGDLPIDGALVNRKQNQMVELPQGCICCTLDSKLEETLWQIVKNQEEVDLLLIESTGTADPGNIGASFLQPAMQKHFDLLSGICVVDPETVEERLQQVPETGKQISFATDIVINKTGYASQEYLQKLAGILGSINPFAEIRYSSDGTADPGELLRPKIRNNQQVHQEWEDGHHRQHEVNSISYITRQTCDINELTSAVQSMLLLYNHQIYRVKGVVFDHTGQAHLLQSAGKHVTCDKLTEWDEDSQQTRLVFIGKGLQEKTINRLLRKPFK